MTRPVYIIDGARTPFLKAIGVPGPFTASDLAVHAGRALLTRLGLEPNHIDEVILGCVMPGPDEANIARVVALRLGLGHAVPAWTVQRNCASGMQALDSAYRNIALGRSEVVLAGGTEAMSHAPLLLSNKMAEWIGLWAKAKTTRQRLSLLGRLRLSHLKPVIGLLRGLRDPIVGLSMGQTAEVIAERFGVTREMMDRYSVRSHERLARAADSGHLEELVPIFGADGTVYDTDNGLRRGGSVEKLSKLSPVFDSRYGKVTAGNSAQITDGAALVVLASEQAVEKYKLPVLARFVETEWAGLDPSEMGLGPVYSTAKLLKRHGLGRTDIEYWEINEAFSGQVLACVEAFKDAAFSTAELGLEGAFGEIDIDRLNVDGGGVSMGHPVGASGARIVLHLAHVLRRGNHKRGVATLCIGGGQGGATLVERVE